jgi:hypothetical protein
MYSDTCNFEDKADKKDQLPLVTLNVANKGRQRGSER